MVKLLAAVVAELFAGLLIATVLGAVFLGSTHVISLPVRLSDEAVFLLFMFFGLLGLGDLYLLYLALAAFERDRYDRW